MLHVESIVVRRDRIIAVAKMDAGAPRFTSASLMDLVLARFPDLPSHACVNARGDRFGAVMDHTSIPHVLEHLVIDLQADAYTKRHAAGDERETVDPPLLTGTTKWMDRAEGLAQVQVSYFDDLVALSAFREAVDFLNGLEAGD